jgi:hypothetical protein
VEVPVFLLIGWAFYPIRRMRETEVDWANVGTAAVALVLLTLGLHAFCRWFYASRRPGQSWPWRWSLGLIGILLLAFVAGIAAIGITHQATWLATTNERLTEGGLRQLAGRTQATNNLKQMGLAAHGYHDANRHLPPGGTFDAQGRGLHGWQTLLLPYLDRQDLFQKVDLQKPWNAPGNLEVMQQGIYVFQSPLVDTGTKEEPYSLSHFAANVHVLGLKSLKLEEITDGTSNTMLMGDISQNFRPWGMPGNWRDPALGLYTSPDSFGGPDLRRKLTLIAFCDGTVHAVRADVSLDVMKAIATPRGGVKFDAAELDR